MAESQGAARSEILKSKTTASGRPHPKRFYFCFKPYARVWEPSNGTALTAIAKSGIFRPVLNISGKQVGIIF